MDAHHAALSSLSLGTGSDRKLMKHVDEAQLALEKEVHIFNDREKFFLVFRVSLKFYLGQRGFVLKLLYSVSNCFLQSFRSRLHLISKYLNDNFMHHITYIPTYIHTCIHTFFTKRCRLMICQPQVD